MTKSEKKKVMATNTSLWIAAMILPGICHFGFASAKFPWPLILPLLLIGPVLASNQMLSRAIGEATDDPETKEQK